MKGLKVNLKEAQKAKRKILDNKLLNFRYKIKKEKDYLIFPVIETCSLKGEYVNVEFKEHKKKESWIDILKKELSEKELKFLKTAHDVVGGIAILEIPNELKNKEKLIAKTLLKSNKNIKTILKKAGEHEGTFRTQSMSWIAGEKTKETIYKENNVSLKLNVEEVYFSSRLSTERKRIMQQVKKGEDVLVMFSGCAPYPCALGKNTKANTITGIELNPIGHKYGEENIILNKLKNVRLINGDVNKVLPNIYKHIIGLKSSIKDNELKNRYEKNPFVFEFFLRGSDVMNKAELEKKILELKKKGITEIYLHMPHTYNNKPVYLDQKSSLELHLKLANIAFKHNVNTVMHVSRGKLTKKSIKQIEINVNAIRSKYPGLIENNYYFENLIRSFSEEKEILMLGKKIGMKNLCLDVAHHFQRYGDNDKLLKFVKTMKSKFKTYFHLNDAANGKEGLEIGTGKINFEQILPLVNRGITEVVSEDEEEAGEMIRSYDKIITKKPFFDRILMPLPKSAEDFLKAAFSVAKKGTIIHFYDFLHETEFEEAENKIKKACEKVGLKYKVIEFVKCGQYSPGKFRVCLDFKIV